MRVLLTGASGFIGSHLAEALCSCGHEVVCAVHAVARAPRRACTSHVEVDFSRDFDSSLWVPRLAGVHAVINAVGILRENRVQSFEALHVRTPVALFDACVVAGVRRVIQISALGADENARSHYHISKRRADEHLASLPLEWTIVQPSLVYGPGGASARLLTGLASLPCIPVPGRGDQLVQPLHIEDLVQGMLRLLDTPAGLQARIPFVGPAPITLRQLLTDLRSAMELGRAPTVHIPVQLVRAAARLGDLWPSSLLDTETLDMLVRGNTGDPQPLQRLLGRAPRTPEQFIRAADVPCTRTQAGLFWLLPALRWSIAIVWLVTAFVSLGLYPTQASYELLARVGISRAVAPIFLYGAAFMDLAFGAATLLMRRRRLLWLAQIAAILLYTLVITVRLPEFWLHPFGPILKNVPLLMSIVLLYELEER